MLARLLGGQLESVDGLFVAFISHTQKEVAPLQRDFRNSRPEVGPVFNAKIMYYILGKNKEWKAVYTTTTVECGWPGAAMHFRWE